jgi:hypothetical protein
MFILTIVVACVAGAALLMANEITKTVYLKSSKSGGGVDSANGASPTKNHNQTGSHCWKQTLTVTQAVDVQIPIPSSLGTPRDLLVENLDATNYIEVSYGTGGSFSGARSTKVLPLDRIIIQPISATIYAKANTADCVCQFSAVQA